EIAAHNGQILLVRSRLAGLQVVLRIGPHHVAQLRSAVGSGLVDDLGHVFGCAAGQAPGGLRVVRAEGAGDRGVLGQIALNNFGRRATEISGYAAGLDDFDAHAERGQLVGKRLRKAFHRKLRGVIKAAHWHRHSAAKGRDIDDSAAVLRPEMGQHGLRHGHQAEDVHLELPPNLGVGSGLEDAEGAEAGIAGGHRGGNSSGLLHVELGDQHLW
nr:hypothetical protein [Tanacetum cinerariifolium]